MEENMKSNKILDGINFLLGVSALVAILIITLGVICRFILKISITWSDELLRTLFMYCYFIGAAIAYKEIGLMRLEILDDILRKKGKLLVANILKIGQGVVETAFWGILCYYIFGTISSQISAGQTTTTSNTPAWVMTAGFGIGLVLLVLFGILKTINCIKALKQA